MRRAAVAYLRGEQDTDLKAFGVKFDIYYLESSLYTEGKVDETIDALKAERWGLIEELVVPEELDAAVARMVDPILESGPNAIRLQKQLITDWEDLPMRAAVQKGIQTFAQTFATSDEPNRMLAETVQRLAARKRG